MKKILLAFSLFILSMQHCYANKIGISSSEVYVTQESVFKLFVAANKTEIAESTADVYLLLGLPDGGYLSLESIKPISFSKKLKPFFKQWEIRSLMPYKLLDLIVSKNAPIGKYQWVLMLVKEGQDPLKKENIITIKIQDIELTKPFRVFSGPVGDFSPPVSSIAATTSSLGFPVSGSPTKIPVQAGVLTAGDIDDNLNFDAFLNYLQQSLANNQGFQSRNKNLPALFVADRAAFLFQDKNQNPLANTKVIFKNQQDGSKTFSSYTNSDGHFYLYPQFDKLHSIRKGDATTTVKLKINLNDKATLLPRDNKINPDNIATYHATTLLNITDISGRPMLMQFYFAHVETWVKESSKWILAVRIKINTHVCFFNSAFAGFSFDANGKMTAPSLNNLQQTLSLTTTGLESQKIILDYSLLSQVGSTFKYDISADGQVSQTQETKQQYELLIGENQQFSREITINENLATAMQTIVVDTIDAQTIKKLDIMLVIDTTGSMSDELNYLTAEFKNIIQKIKEKYLLEIRYGLVLYRDIQDQYVVRKFPFTSSIETMTSQLEEQQAVGGGDYPEAMDQAFKEALNANWSSDPSTAKLLFLVADAPPHQENLSKMLDLTQISRAKGIKVYGLAASGVGDAAEYIMRVVSMLTQARYLFLTDDSGVGNTHAEPTIPCYQATTLDKLMLRVIDSELSTQRKEAAQEDIVREVGHQQHGVCEASEPTPNNPPIEQIPFLTKIR